MTQKNCIKPVAAVIGAALVGSLSAVNVASAAENPFGASQLESGYMVVASMDEKEGKCGEGKAKEGKCGEGKAMEGKCGEGKATEGKCGEGKAMEGKKKEGKCGEGKCGEGKK
jgi:uncharacterized low-complexity protein